jgi:hypothetical protein
MNSLKVFAAAAFLVLAGAWPALAQEMLTPSITVGNQDIINSRVVVQKVVSDGPGWVVIHEDINGAPGPVLGYAAVQDGVNPDVVVAIDSQKATSKLFAMLHTDKGTVGVYQFPGPDVPVFSAGVMVNVPFAVLNAPGKPVAQASSMQGSWHY